MKYLKKFKESNIDGLFPENFNNLYRGIRNVDRVEFIDDPKERAGVNIGFLKHDPVHKDRYIEFLKNFEKFGIPNIFKSVYISIGDASIASDYGDVYKVIPKIDSKFGFCRLPNRPNLFSVVQETYTSSHYLSNGEYDFCSKQYNKDQIDDYQKFLIDSKMIGVLSYSEMSNILKDKIDYRMNIWTESPCLLRRI